MQTPVLYISYDGMTDPLGQSQVIPYIKGLSEKGFRFTLLSAEKKENFHKAKDAVLKELSEYNIGWEYIIYTKKPPVLSTLYDIQKLKTKALSLYRQSNFRIVHCRSYIAALVGLYLKKKISVKFIFDMRGFYADERVDGKIWNLKNPLYNLIYRYFKRKEIEFFTMADYSVCLTNSGKEIIQNWDVFRNHKPSVEVIPCCTDLNHFSKNNIDPVLKNKFKAELSLSDTDFVLSYLGSIGTWYMPEEMLLFFKRLLLKKPESKFLFITKDNPEVILSIAEKLQINKNKILVCSAGRNEMPTLLSLSNISIFFIKPVFSKKASSPTKLGEIMGMGIPVICNSGVGDVDHVIKHGESGILVNKFETNDFDKAIDTMDALLKIPSQNFVDIAEKYFSLQKGIESYYKIYQAQ
ncbi:MAG: glycosyltransferase [Bacteroidia bacterium]|nr:glycosyltransferase [Bacteroidia bacterium]